jgi:hypothetical protein
MKQYYTLVLNSTNSSNRTGTAPSFSYNINWDAIFPQNLRDKKFAVSFVFSSLVVTTPFTEVYTVNINFGTTNVYNQTPSQSAFLGVLYSYMTSATAYFAMANINDNSPVTISYPTNRIITVSIGNANLASSTVNITDYILTLQFTPLD